MSTSYNVYCDESCHLERDHQRVMVLGAVWCPVEKTREIADRIREIKVRHGMSPAFEAKWSKVSPAQQRLYLDLVDYFFDDDDLQFRALVADKTRLQHETFSQAHDSWYYKMYFSMLKVLFGPSSEYQIYLDIKDTRSAEKMRGLHDVLCNNAYDFERRIIKRVQTVRSHEIEQMQLADLLIGAIGYANRGLQSSSAKTALVHRIRRRSKYSLTQTTLLREDKVNLLVWQPSTEP
jgi:hypothetical protein